MPALSDPTRIPLLAAPAGGECAAGPLFERLYVVSGNTLQPKHADGTITRHTIFPYELNKKVQLNIDGCMYKRL